MADLKILQVVGYKNSGKTTLISSWIKELGKRNKSVAVVKNHGHGGGLELPDSHTDSMRFMTSGASSSLVYGGNLIQLHMRSQQSGLPQLLQIAKLANPDMILIEGFKKADYPKVVLIREPEDWATLGHLSHIIGVITREGVVLENVATIPRQHVHQTNMLLNKWMDGGLYETI